jgi:hypothetical protein
VTLYVCLLRNSSKTTTNLDSKIEDMVHMTIEMVYVHWLNNHAFPRCRKCTSSARVRNVAQRHIQMTGKYRERGYIVQDYNTIFTRKRPVRGGRTGLPIRAYWISAYYCVCVCARACAHVRACVCACTHRHILILHLPIRYPFFNMPVFTCARTHTHTHIQTHTYTYTYKHTHTHTHAHTHTHTHTHTHINKPILNTAK